MVAMPLEQNVVALAAKCTGDLKVVPLVGLLMVTVAEAEIARIPITAARKGFMNRFLLIS
jgi:hypothetical protein